MKFSEYGIFKIYVDGEFLLKVHCTYGDVLDLLWPLHFDKPDAEIEIVPVTD